jgi:hypothetical protein
MPRKSLDQYSEDFDAEDGLDENGIDEEIVEDIEEDIEESFGAEKEKKVLQYLIIYFDSFYSGVIS